MQCKHCIYVVLAIVTKRKFSRQPGKIAVLIALIKNETELNMCFSFYTGETKEKILGLKIWT